jgi:hypothetical protein
MGMDVYLEAVHRGGGEVVVADFHQLESRTRGAEAALWLLGFWRRGYSAGRRAKAQGGEVGCRRRRERHLLREGGQVGPSALEG